MGKFTELRDQLANFAQLKSQVSKVISTQDELQESIASAIELHQEAEVFAALEKLPIERIKDATETIIKLEYLRRAGFSSIADLQKSSTGSIAAIPGISNEVAIEIKSIVNTMAKAIAESLGVSISAELDKKAEAELVDDLENLKIVSEDLRGSKEKLPQVKAAIEDALNNALVAHSRFRWWFAGKDKRAIALNAASNLQMFLVDPATATAMVAVNQVLSRLPFEKRKPEQLKELFAKNSSTYYSLLEDVQGKPLSGATTSHFDAELIKRIEAHEFDLSLINATLRRYQIFGTKFALEQRRVILGDEMGLGKTMQALGVLAQRKKLGATRMLVVCPASVIINWTREITERTNLVPIKIHGDSYEINLADWKLLGGLALTTFDMLKRFDVTDEELVALQLDTLIVDEAHFAKNLHTGRSREVQRWAKLTPHVLFMTGTPMENRVDEFMGLVGMLDRELSQQLDMAVLSAGPEPFKVAVAPVYLRRNGLEVLKELPDLIEITEDCDWSGVSKDFYSDAVTKGNFMAMRRAAYVPFPGAVPSKMERLLEIVDEAFENNEKVIVFSFFRKVIDSVIEHLGEKAMGPITGGVSPARRQEIIDSFTNSPTPKVLVGQIQAAGTGLNIQSASVVILCEPQIKPSLETQAIARAHRMGQVKTVQVHRLHIETSVDAGMRVMLKGKQDEFESYARDSALADGSKLAKDVNEHQLAKVILLEERRRLNIDSDADVSLEGDE